MATHRRFRSHRAAVGLAVAGALVTAPARAEDAGPAGGGDRTSLDYFSEQGQKPLTYWVEPPRTRGQKIVLASLAGATLAAGGLGLYFHLESKRASDEVSRFSGDHSGLVYTDEVDRRRRDALDNRTRAIAMYATGGVLLVGTVAYFIWTSPDPVERSYADDAEEAGRQTWWTPVPGGAVAGASWTF
ncbi:MAG: hypothetical protein D6689_10355 [Deltaproteobacteria bacterium]|nr:MAG: hypothetical protein D6689_10355 [Deltaproteobacteria bacterium]